MNSEVVIMNDKRCVVCNKQFDSNNKLYGPGCLKNMYDLVNIPVPSGLFKDKEKFLCTKIAHKNHKYFLSLDKKYFLSELYISLLFINRMNLKFLDDIKNKIISDISNVKIFSSNNIKSVNFKLNDVYKLFNDYEKFMTKIKEYENIDLKKVDDATAKQFIKGLSFIFDLKKKTNPIDYVVYYSMQYMFWKMVVVGGLFANMKLSAKLLDHSISDFGKKPSNLEITDKYVIDIFDDDGTYKNKINDIIKKYGNNDFIDTKKIEDYNSDIEFNEKDLLYAIHGSDIHFVANKISDNSWKLIVELNDRYDFTKFRDIEKYFNSNKSIISSMLSTVLNNFGVVSSEYGVLKPYKFSIKFVIDDYVIE